jgi:Trk K+ transport system NAD-binding subunit
LDNPLFYKRLSVLGVYKFSSQTFLFNPDKLTGIEAGDVVIVVANRSLIEEFRNKLHRGLRG